MTTKEAMTVSIKPWYDVIKKYISVKDANIFNDFVNALINGCVERLDSHRWIPVSERLPEDGNQTVLALIDVDNKPVLANYYGEPYYSWHEITDGVNLEKRVTHWRELPPPPEGE